MCAGYLPLGMTLFSPQAGAVSLRLPMALSGAPPLIKAAAAALGKGFARRGGEAPRDIF